MKQVQVHPPNPQWPHDFEAEVAQIALALGDHVACIHHIGSTSIANIYAKPVIDMLVEVSDLALTILLHRQASRPGDTRLVAQLRHQHPHALAGARQHAGL